LPPAVANTCLLIKFWASIIFRNCFTTPSADQTS
jgi:hypothetical protein